MCWLTAHIGDGGQFVVLVVAELLTTPLSLPLWLVALFSVVLIIAIKK